MTENTGKKNCFVISPIGEENTEIRAQSDKLLRYIIRPAVEDLGYEAERADEVAHSGLINSLVFERLKDAPLVIADLTGGNPNVMYELAIRHALQKPVIHIKEEGKPIPFDLANLQVIEYGFEVEVADIAKSKIQKCIQDIESGESHPQYTPINLAIDLRTLRASDQPEQRSLAEILSMVSDIRSGMGRLSDDSRQILNVIRSEHDASDSVYAERAEHYRKEKWHLARKFIRRILGQRAKYLKAKAGDGAALRIIFDSGSTIAPMFHVLGQEAESDPDHWCRDIPVVTNSIKAVENILKYRDRPGDRYAGLPIRRFSVLPGEVLAAFEAIADASTLAALEELRQDKVYTIAVTTGNYILFHEGKFLPIARAGFHPDFKATLYDMADEVYVVAPLGKVLMWTDSSVLNNLEDLLAHLNNSLGFQSLPREEESADKQYQLVSEKLVWSKGPELSGLRGLPDISPWLRKTVLVTTSRTEHCIFHQHSNQIESRDFRSDWELGSGPHLVTIPFSALPVSAQDQFEVEVPHENLRKVAHHYFFLPDDWQSKTEKEREEDGL